MTLKIGVIITKTLENHVLLWFRVSCTLIRSPTFIESRLSFRPLARPGVHSSAWNSEQLTIQVNSGLHSTERGHQKHLDAGGVGRKGTYQLETYQEELLLLQKATVARFVISVCLLSPVSSNYWAAWRHGPFGLCRTQQTWTLSLLRLVRPPAQRLTLCRLLKTHLLRPDLSRGVPSLSSLEHCLNATRIPLSSSAYESATLPSVMSQHIAPTTYENKKTTWYLAHQEIRVRSLGLFHNLWMKENVGLQAMVTFSVWQNTPNLVRQDNSHFSVLMEDMIDFIFLKEPYFEKKKNCFRARNCALGLGHMRCWF